jgi:hypothetical protein
MHYAHKNDILEHIGSALLVALCPGRLTYRGDCLPEPTLVPNGLSSWQLYRVPGLADDVNDQLPGPGCRYRAAFQPIDRHNLKAQ